MNKFPQLTEDEVRYICSVIPLQESVEYFKKYPKDFAKVMPGFRATSIKSHAQMETLLFRYHTQPFISSFIEKHISRWLDEIQMHMNKCIENGESKELAYIHTFPFCFFADNIVLYFKLIEEEYPEEYIALLTSAIVSIKDEAEERRRTEELLKENESENKRLLKELDYTKANLEGASNKLNIQLQENIELKNTITDLEKLVSVVQRDEETITTLKVKLQEYEEIIQQLKMELSESRDSYQNLEAKLRTDLEKQQADTAAKLVVRKLKCPKDREEFKDYLGYNLTNIGVPTNSEYYALLKEHLCCILFQGKPIMINHGTSAALMKCVSNALSGTSNIKTLTFREDISIQIANDFLSTDGRVVCLDNFVGNFNETELLPLFDHHKDKIIFLTVAYDRTLHYISEEFLRYCYYLNLNRIRAFISNFILTEDPSTVEEIEVEPQRFSLDTRHSLLLKEILREFGFRQSLVEHKCISVYTEQDLCSALAFDVLPYCIDVLGIAPYKASERLVKYAGDAGRCPYKNLFKEWFA